MIPFFHGAVDLTARVFDRGVLPLVVEFFALAQGDLQLDAGVFKIDGEGNDRIALHLDLCKQVGNLALMQQQPPRTHGVFIVDIAFFIRADVHLTDPYLAVLDGAPRIFEV